MLISTNKHATPCIEAAELLPALSLVRVLCINDRGAWNKIEPPANAICDFVLLRRITL
jgi:hypothetical protein